MEEMEQPLPPVLEEALEDPTAPFAAARAQREASAAITAEHDEIIAEILYEITMKDLEE